MSTIRLTEYIFFYGLLIAVGYLMWQVMAPFFAALVIAAIVASVTYPLYVRIRSHMPGNSAGLGAILTTFVVVLVVLTPLSFLGYRIFSEIRNFYTAIGTGDALSAENFLLQVELVVQKFIPDFSLDITSYAQQAAAWLAENVGAIFAGTASTIFMLFIAVITIFYAYRDGARFVRFLVQTSPLPDTEDDYIIERLARSVRSVILGTLTVALIQGTLTGIGFAIFGISQPVLWGTVAAVGALIPGIGTSIVFIPAVGFLLFTGAYGAAAGLAIWGMLAVGLIDNLLGPYLMSRGVTLHPLFVLLSVLGGIALFGPIGFIVGPVTLSLFVVLLELYRTYMDSSDT